MKIFVKSSYQDLKTSRAKRPFIGLVHKDWNDWGWRTRHQMYLFHEDGYAELFGETKILNPKNKTTKLDDSFTKICDGFISLGQSLEFYRKLSRILGKPKARALLENLNDVAVKPGLAEASEVQLGLANSLLRETEAKEAFHWGNDVLKGNQPSKDFDFEYSCQFKGADCPLITHINFTRDNNLPWRVIGIIGKNGVGKTQFLGNLARDLAPPTREILSERAIHKLDNPFSNRPVFSRIVALSFSAFDQFSKPARSDYFSYIYCGARDSNGRLSNSWMKNRFAEYIQRIDEMGNMHLWKKYLKEIAGDVPWQKMEDPEIDDEDDGNESVADEIANLSANDWDLSSLSSGQSIVAYSVAAIIAYLQPRSLLLFDEPELHLHPAAISKLIKIVYELLDHFKSYAIITTHSLIITQEIPRKNIRVFDREGNVTTSRELAQESFGRNLEELSQLVFGNSENEQFYKHIFKTLSSEMKFDEVLSLFGDELSLNAMAYLSSLYND